jgi:hypothetical protein
MLSVLTFREGGVQPAEREDSRRWKTRWLAGWASVWAVLAASSSSLPVAQNKNSPPVILVSVDTLRADRLSCYGYKGLQTPNIDGLTRGGDPVFPSQFPGAADVAVSRLHADFNPPLLQWHRG